MDSPAPTARNGQRINQLFIGYKDKSAGEEEVFTDTPGYTSESASSQTWDRGNTHLTSWNEHSCRWTHSMRWVSLQVVQWQWKLHSLTEEFFVKKNTTDLKALVFWETPNISDNLNIFVYSHRIPKSKHRQCRAETVTAYSYDLYVFIVRAESRWWPPHRQRLSYCLKMKTAHKWQTMMDASVSMRDVLATERLCSQELCYFWPVQVDHLLPQETLKPHRWRCYNVSLCANFVRVVIRWGLQLWQITFKIVVWNVFFSDINRGVLFEHFSYGYLKTSAPKNLKHSLNASKSSSDPQHL